MQYVMTSAKLPSGITYPVNILLELGIKIWRDGPAVFWHENNGGYVLDSSQYDLVRFLPSIDPAKTYQFSDRLDLKWCHEWPVENLADTPVILFVRNGKDAAFSDYKRQGLDISFSEYLRKPLQSAADSFDQIHHKWHLPPAEVWALFNLLWLNICQKNKGLVIRYEDIKQYPIQETQKLLKYLGVSRNIDDIEIAISKSSFEAARKAEINYISESSDSDKKIYNRKGTPGESELVFGREESACFEGLPAFALNVLGYTHDYAVPSSATFATIYDSVIRESNVSIITDKLIHLAKGSNSFDTSFCFGMALGCCSWIKDIVPANSLYAVELLKIALSFVPHFVPKPTLLETAAGNLIGINQAAAEMLLDTKNSKNYEKQDSLTCRTDNRMNITEGSVISSNPSFGNTFTWAKDCDCKDLIQQQYQRYLSGINVKRVLDIGCGTNEEITLIAPNADEYFFLDQYFLPPQKDKYHLLKQSVSAKLPFPDNYLDVVTSNGAFDHFKQEDRVRIFLEIERCLKPGGIMLFACEYIDFDAAGQIFNEIAVDEDMISRNCPHYDNINLYDIVTRLSTLKICQVNTQNLPDGKPLSCLVSKKDTRYYTEASKKGTLLTWSSFFVVLKKDDDLAATGDREKNEIFEEQLRDKWQEIPSTRQGRAFSTDLLTWPDDALLAHWEECRQQTTTPEVRGWFQDLYKDDFAGLEIADVGPGVGVDGIYFAQRGANVTFVDIVEDNLKLLERICTLKGIKADYYFIDDFFNYRFKRNFDVFLFIGSMINAPFDFTKRQINEMMKFLRPGGKTLMLAYPEERYIQSGAKSFEEFGKMTDGERTPWVEWYDDAKVKALFGPEFNLNWSRNFGQDNIEFNWFDLTKINAGKIMAKAEDTAGVAVGEYGITIPMIHVLDLQSALNFRMPLEYPKSSLTKKFTDWKMEEDDAPIFRYIYHNAQPRRHLEFGTWQGKGTVFCLEESNATVWTINLPFGEGPYGFYDEELPDAHAWARRIGVAVSASYSSDSIGFIGKAYLERNLGNRVCQIYSNSLEWDTRNFPEGFFDTVLIDGGHTKEVVASDTRKALPLLRPGGIIMWHDFCPTNYQKLEVCWGVMAGVAQEWDYIRSNTTKLFWIYPSMILLGIKR